MPLLILSATLNLLFLFAWLLQSFSLYSFREECTYVILTTLMVVSSIISLIWIRLKRHRFSSQMMLALHLPSIFVVVYLSLALITNPIGLILSFPFSNPGETAEFDSPTGQKTIVFREDCDILECAHGTTAYLNLGLLHQSLEIHVSDKNICRVDNQGFEQLKDRQAHVRWSRDEKQIEWNLRGNPCVIRL